jgi:ATP-dependent RNA helicase DDX24/MAK5
VTLHEQILTNLRRLGFSKPTPIQEQVLPAALVKRKEVIGGAVTGSGKTLAFGIPIVQRLLAEHDALPAEQQANNRAEDDSVSALVLTPTRELALQVCQHISALTKGTALRAVAIVGGMSAQKQLRQLRSRPQIVVATPGRFYELLNEGDCTWLRLHRLSFFVLDEADRMIEAGHYEELTEIIGQLPRGKETGASERQIFLFTATLHAAGVDGVGRERHTIGTLQKRLPFRSAPLVIDLGDTRPEQSSKSVGAQGDHGAGTAKVTGISGLKECAIVCENSKKDEHLYYFLCRYPGRTIVFVNAISSIRRLSSLLSILKLPVLALHSGMQQRARIKTVERFLAQPDVVLLATDVAARGIDIKGVGAVIHYQMAKSTDTYVHRRGRTARAGAEGLSLALVGEAEMQLLRRTLREIGYDASRSLPNFPVDHKYLNALKKRLQLARKIDDVARTHKKQSAEAEWLRKAAEDLDVDLSDDENADIAMDSKRVRKALASQRRELDDLLNRPLVPEGFTTRHLAMDPHLARTIVASAEEAASSAAAVNSSKRKKSGVGAVRPRSGNMMTVEAGGSALETLALGKAKAGKQAVALGLRAISMVKDDEESHIPVPHKKRAKGQQEEEQEEQEEQEDEEEDEGEQVAE